jgi:hypothetical protein
MAPNIAHVFGNVVFERFLVRQNLVADAAGRVAQVDLKVTHAVLSRAVRLVAHAANESSITFVKLPRRIGRPSLDWRIERTTCKFQVAR